MEQQKEWTPGIRGVVVKRAINMRAVEGKSPAEARREIQLVAPDTVEFTRESMPEAYRIIRVLYRFINPD